MEKETKQNILNILLVVGGVTVVITLILTLMFGLPVYGVWRAGLSGEASLAKAEEEKKILVEQARAEVEAASLRAEAIQIVGQATKDFPEYRLQEFLGACTDYGIASFVTPDVGIVRGLDYGRGRQRR